MKKTTINWGTFYDIEVMLCREGENVLKGKGAPYPMPHVMGESVRRTTEDGRTFFVLAFNGEFISTMETITHECFHMFFQILEYSGETPLTLPELTREIYAIKYEDLVHKTLKALEKLGAFESRKSTGKNTKAATGRKKA